MSTYLCILLHLSLKFSGPQHATAIWKLHLLLYVTPSDPHTGSAVLGQLSGQVTGIKRILVRKIGALQVEIKKIL